MAADEENPGDPKDWSNKLILDHIFLRPEKFRVFHAQKTRESFERLRINRHSRVVEAFLERKGYRVDDESLVRIKLAANQAIMLGHEQLMRNADEDYRPDPEAERFPLPIRENKPASAATANKAGKASLLDVFDRYAKESQVKPATIKRWRPIVAKAEKAHPRLSDITPEWAIGWKNELVASGLNNNTIRDAYPRCGPCATGRSRTRKSSAIPSSASPSRR